MRASPVMKRHSTLAPSRLRSASHALVPRPSASTSGNWRFPRHWRTKADISILVMFSHEPRTGVYIGKLDDVLLSYATPVGIVGSPRSTADHA